MKNKQIKRQSFKYRFLFQIAASSFLILAAFLIKKNLPDFFEKIKSSLSYTPDISVYSQYAKDFILKYTPR